jgi:subtilisin family serine protease
VGASNKSDNRAWFSNYGSELDVIAPGIEILSTVPTADLGPRHILNEGGNKLWYPTGDYEDNGTSVATPFVSGLAALILSTSPASTNVEVRTSICDSATDVWEDGFDNQTGWGRINASAGVIYVPPPRVAAASNYPNPFNPKNGEETTIDIPQNIAGSYLKVKIYNIAGELVCTKQRGASSYYVKWNGKNGDGEVVASGIYFYTAETNKGRAKGKLTLIK